MKIKFDPNQDHQRHALESVFGVFEGQELNKTTFSMPTIQHVDQSTPDMYSNQTDRGYANRLKLLPEEILENIRQIQLKNGLKQSKGELKNFDFLCFSGRTVSDLSCRNKRHNHQRGTQQATARRAKVEFHLQRLAGELCYDEISKGRTD